MENPNQEIQNKIEIKNWDFLISLYPEFLISEPVLRIFHSINKFFSRSEQSWHDRISKSVASNGMREIDKF